MFNCKEINTRFLSFFEGWTQYQIAEHYGISQSTVSEWATGKTQVPWEKLKELVDSQQVSWNWLLEGLGPRDRAVHLEPLEIESGKFCTPEINRRFLDLFPDMTQQQLAEYFDVTQPTISGWKTFDRQIPWERLKSIVDSKNVSWEWLLEGIPPIYS